MFELVIDSFIVFGISFQDVTTGKWKLIIEKRTIHQKTLMLYSIWILIKKRHIYVMFCSIWNIISKKHIYVIFNFKCNKRRRHLCHIQLEI